MGSSKAIPKGEESQNVSVLLPAEPIRPSEASEGTELPVELTKGVERGPGSSLTHLTLKHLPHKRNLCPSAVMPQ